MLSSMHLRERRERSREIARLRLRGIGGLLMASRPKISLSREARLRRVFLSGVLGGTRKLPSYVIVFCMFSKIVRNTNNQTRGKL